MTYRVTLEDHHIWIKDREVKVNAVCVVNAKAIAEMRYKGKIASKAVRLGNELSPVMTMNILRNNFIQAKDEMDLNQASSYEKTFYETLASLQSEMNIVDFAMARQYLPDLPPMGK